jgi:arginase
VRVQLILVPYDSGHRGLRLGAGPERLGGPITDRLTMLGHEVHSTVVEPGPTSWRAEVGTTFELAAAVAREVRAARTAHAFPLVLAGNCFATLGVVAALGANAGLIWWDAHADFNTPETSVSGFLDGMALATIVGRSWTALRRQVDGFVPLPEDHVWLVGARDLDPAETVALDGSGVRRVPPSVVSPALATTIGRQATSIARFALHVDLDVLDAGEGRANSYAVGGGVSSNALVDTCSACARDLLVEALTLSAYDPACDVDRRVIDAAVGVAEGVVTESAASYRDRDRIITSSSPPGSTS